MDVAAAVCVAGGVLGAALAGYLAGESGAASVYPHPVRGSAALQIVLALCHVGPVLGLLSLWSSGVVPRTRRARLAHHAAVAVLAALTVAEGIAISVPVSAFGATPRAFAVVYAVYTVLLGIALLVLGVEVARRGTWPGLRRWLTAVLGLWLLVAVLPALAFAPALAGWAVAAWLLLFAVLGLTLVRRSRRPEAERAALPARAFAVVTWVYVAGFGSASVPVAASLLESGQLPSFFGVFRMYAGPWSIGASPSTLVVLTTVFLALTLTAAWAAWLVRHGSRAGAVLAVVLLPVEALFWYGLSLPIPWLLGVARLVLLVAAWRTVGARSAALRS
ncbi:hypothetical protein [Pseudonocardia broussonetiae]|uniref:Uncharacterized protein n=1 Tax=Pseudonocardia broussonetiae TaxID=2736640 RepID=A0A6M6JIM4_9PSEU|nr:hypothetical protein [Pseudonocardia broussonetiae]QJY47914.1 hypothetical protein HOP40_20665 [Pseudonocardia broussonetiae]